MILGFTVATISDWSFLTATGIYLLAMVFATVSSSANTRIPVAVGALEPPLRDDRAGRMGLALTWLGFGLHAAAVVARGIAAHRWPLGNLYEYVMVITLVATGGWLIVASRFPVRHMAVWVLLPVAGLMVLDGKVFYAQAAPVSPALQSYWLIIHVTTAAAATGALVVPGIASVLYLVRAARPHLKLPPSETLDRVAYRATIIGFPLFTFAVICGAVWAESAWGRFWGWDPKEVTSFVAWVMYAAYLHARATAGWRGVRAAVLNVLGLAVLVFNLTFVNLVTSGMHSYTGLN
ncbi:c-type cytochrome biogenesis protein CcsB [Amycolatopsis taiwanensis]|uniref:c-type cytochrome biogenesis protein CcsB n=1 Tax=Amycolatopsis taiwanensis TaxID=342230 RepID=UPI00047F3438|nr:c-type cytochrome biogenesis protein CcsB [Amycolatopsis taiwanensis]